MQAKTVKTSAHKEAYQLMTRALGNHFWEVNKILDTWNGPEIGYNLRASSVLRKNVVLPMIDKFISDHNLPLKRTEKYPFTNAFEIYYIK